MLSILTVNAGSSSVKCALFNLASPPSVEAHSPDWHEEVSFGKPDSEAGSVTEAVRKAIEAIRSSSGSQKIHAVGHRVVHGGETYTNSIEIDDDVISEIQRLQQFAPLHNKLDADGIKASIELLPEAKQFAVFDTSFHKTIPDHAAIYPGPYEWYESHRIKRYGFHGINHEYVTHRAASLLSKPVSALNIISCHLGSGCSISTISGGKSIDNSMGFTPLEGLMMGTRSGSIDPGILLKLLRDQSISVEKLDETLNKHSGLLGVSGISNDMRVITNAAAEGIPRAKLALAMFLYRLQSHIASCIAHLPSLDALVFTAGIGEHSALVRAQASKALAMLGADVDPKLNESASADCNIASSTSNIAILVITAREDWQIARECYRLLRE